MDKILSYNRKTMTLSIHIGKYYKFLQCPFATWWKARKYFKRPKFKFYFGRMQKKEWYSGFSKFIIQPYFYIDKGFRYFVSADYLKWSMSKWFPILVESRDICWKDKFDTPRYEHPGFFSIIIGRNLKTAWQFAIVVKAPNIYFLNNGKTKDKIHSDAYWESILWYNNYYKEYKSDKPDLKKAFLSETGYLFTNNTHTLSKFNHQEITYKGKQRIDFYKCIDSCEEPFVNGISNLDGIHIKIGDSWIYGLTCYIDTDNKHNYILHCVFPSTDSKNETINYDFDNVEIYLHKHIGLYKTFNELLLTSKGIEELK